MTDAKRWEVLHGDCLDVMRGMADASVDAVVTDPPYGTASASKFQKHGDKPPTDFNIEWDKTLPLQWVAEAVRILRPGGALVAFTDNKRPGMLWEALESAGAKPLQNVFWRKKNPPPQPRKNFCSAVETAVFARKIGSVLHWGGGGYTLNVFDAAIVGGRERTAHPTQKPVDLMRWLCRLVTPPNGIVLDPFTGSGTTGVAALREGFRFVGIEREAQYVEIARARIANEADPKGQSSLL